MYIAIKWLLSMVLAMWIALCSLDVYRRKRLAKEIEYYLPKDVSAFYNNTNLKIHKNSFEIENNIIPIESNCTNVYYHYFFYLALICLASTFKRKNGFLSFTAKKVFNCDRINRLFSQLSSLRKPIQLIGAVIHEYLKVIVIQVLKTNRRGIYLIIFNKLKELNKERRNIGALLSKVLERNKSMALKNNLTDDVQSYFANNDIPQRQIVQNSQRVFIFQHLYLITRQENVFLKSRLKKLMKEKEDAERKLFKLINQVCQSKNSDLKAYCSQFIVHTKNNLLNTDMKAEIDKFLQTSPDAKYFQAHDNISQNTIPSENSKGIEFINNERTVATAENESTFKGPYVCTVKDKDGLIEKIFEYSGGFENGDSIRRIRQYSVYYDTECLLDISNSSFKQDNDDSLRSHYINFKLTAINRKFLSNSEAFKHFLQNNKSVIAQRSTLSNSVNLLT